MIQSETLASVAYERLRGDIIGGLFKPGEKVRIRALCEEYGIGPSPIREALNRLSSEGLLKQTDQRGFRVPPVTLKDLDELVKARCWANEVCLRNSIRTGGFEWEERVISTYAQLERAPRSQSTEAGARDTRWETAHEAFHAALLSASGSSWIEDFCAKTFLAGERYRHSARDPVASSSSRRDEHREIKEATLARREDEAVELLCEHFRKTARLVREALRSGAKAG